MLAHALRPPIPGAADDDEARRLAAVRRYAILDTPPDAAFDRLTALAASLFSAPAALICLVDRDRIWFRSRHGLDVQQIERSPGLCDAAIRQRDPLVLTDAAADARLLSNPLVGGAFGLRFYAGAPLRTHDGHAVGTLCVIDREPRTVDARQVEQLQMLAAVAMDQMELRLAARSAIGALATAFDDRAAALKRAELLAKEIDHRVMNSLQLIAGLLNVQSRAQANREASNQLALAATRVAAIAQIHRHIYQSTDVGTTDCLDYLRRLCGELSDLLRSGSRGEIAIDGVHAQFPVAQLVPVGLIVNELVTNAAKHGGGRTVVSLQRARLGEFALSVSDEGAGLPEAFDPLGASGLGMKVVDALVRQLHGRIEVGRSADSGGARFTVVFPDPLPRILA